MAILTFDDAIAPATAHAAPVSWWEQLQSLLKAGGAPSKVPYGSNVYLNMDGQVVPSNQLVTDASSIARLIYNGDVWVDWCGWPMFFVNQYLDILSGNPGADGFNRFLQIVAEPLSDAPFHASQVWFVPGDISGVLVPIGNAQPVQYSSLQRSMGYPYQRGLWSDRPVHEVQGFAVNFAAPRAQGSYQGHPQYVVSNFAIRYGRGWYFYAYGNSTTFANSFFASGAPQTPEGVSATTYANFILEQLKSPSTQPLSNPPPIGQQPSTPPTGFAALPLYEKILIIGGGGLALALVGYGAFQLEIARAGAAHISVENVLPGAR